MPPKRTKRDGSKWFYSTPKGDAPTGTAKPISGEGPSVNPPHEGGPDKTTPLEAGEGVPVKKAHKRGKRGKKGGAKHETALEPVLSAFGSAGQPTTVLREVGRLVLGETDMSVVSSSSGGAGASSLKVVDKSSRLSLQSLPGRHADLNVAPSNFLAEDPLYGVHRLAPGFQSDRTAVATSLLTSAVSELQWEAARPNPSATSGPELLGEEAPPSASGGGGGGGDATGSTGGRVHRKQPLNFVTTDGALRKIFSGSYQEESDLVLSVHKVGPTLLIQDTPGFEGDTTVAAARNRSLLAKLLYHGVQQQEEAASPSSTATAEMPPLSNRSFGAESGDGLGGALTTPLAVAGRQRAPSPPAASEQGFSTVLRWGLNDLDVLLGSDIPLVYDAKQRRELVLRMKTATSPMSTPSGGCGQPQFPQSPMATPDSFSLPASPAHMTMPESGGGFDGLEAGVGGGTLDLTRNEALESWFDAMITNVRNVAVCVHHNGVVQDYRIVPVGDMLSVVDKLEATKALNFTSQVLQWLQGSCTEEGQSYVLMRQGSTGTLKLFQYDPFSTTGGGGNKDGPTTTSSSQPKVIMPSPTAVPSTTSHADPTTATSLVTTTPTSTPTSVVRMESPLTPPPPPTGGGPWQVEGTKNHHTGTLISPTAVVGIGVDKKKKPAAVSPLRPEAFDAYEGVLLLRMATLGHLSSPPEQILEWCERGLGLLINSDRDLTAEKPQISQAISILPRLLMVVPPVASSSSSIGSGSSNQVVLGVALEDLMSGLTQEARAQVAASGGPQGGLHYVWAVERMNNVFSLIRSLEGVEGRGDVSGLVVQTAAAFLSLVTMIFQQYTTANAATLPFHTRVTLLFAALNGVCLLASSSCMQQMERDDTPATTHAASRLTSALSEVYGDLLVSCMVDTVSATPTMVPPASGTTSSTVLTVPTTGVNTVTTLTLVTKIASAIQSFTTSTSGSGAHDSFAAFLKQVTACKTAVDCSYRALRYLDSCDDGWLKVTLAKKDVEGGVSEKVTAAPISSSVRSRRVLQKQALIYHLIGELHSQVGMRPTKALEALNQSSQLHAAAADSAVEDTPTFGPACVRTPPFQAIVTAHCMSSVYHRNARLLMEVQGASFSFPFPESKAGGGSLTSITTKAAATRNTAMLPAEEDHWLKSIAVQEHILAHLLDETQVPINHPLRRAAAMTTFEVLYQYSMRLSDELEAGRGTKKHPLESLASDLTGVHTRLLQLAEGAAKVELDGRSTLVKLEQLRVTRKSVNTPGKPETVEADNKAKNSHQQDKKKKVMSKNKESKDPERKALEELDWLEQVLAPSVTDDRTDSAAAAVLKIIGPRQALLASNFIFLLLSSHQIKRHADQQRALALGVSYLQCLSPSEGTAAIASTTDEPTPSSSVTTPHDIRLHSELLTQVRLLATYVLKDQHLPPAVAEGTKAGKQHSDASSESSGFSLEEKEKWRKTLRSCLEVEKAEWTLLLEALAYSQQQH